MDKAVFSQIEAHMLACMKDIAHDREHVYRVLYSAADIAKTERDVNTDVLLAACLLHDIGRDAQFKNPALRHEQVGSAMAYEFLLGIRWPEADAAHVRDCIASHSYRGGNPPATLEAKILFDADKLDVSGALGIARTLLYHGIVGEPLYSLNARGEVSDGIADTEPSFFQEYKYKLESLYDKFFTQRARQIAAERRPAAEAFYNSMLAELRACYANGKDALDEAIE